MMMVIHNKNFVGTHHEGIKMSIFLLKLLKVDVWGNVSHETENTPDDRQ